MALLAPLLVFVLGGGVAVVVGRRAGRSWSECGFLAAGYGPLLGLGAASLAYVFATTVHAPRGSWVPLAVVLGAILCLLQRRTPSCAARADTERAPSRPFLLVSAFVCVTAAVILLRGHLLAVERSWEGQWDAHAVWNQRAALLFSGHSELPAALARMDGYFHPDYPLLLPAGLAALYTLTGGPNWPAVCLVHFGIVTGCACVLFFALRRERNMSLPLALAGTAILLISPTFVEASLQQCADVATAYCLVASVVGLASVLSATDDTSAIPAVLVGAPWGLLVFVKNEGLVYGGFIALAFVAFVWDSKISIRRVIPLLLGALPGVIALGVFRLLWIPSAEARGFGAGIGNFLQWERWKLPLRQLARRIVPSTGAEWDWRMMWGFLVCVLVASTAAGLRRLRHSDLFVSTTVVTTVISWLIAYVLSPYDQSWHISTSMSRIMIHAYPVAILAAWSSAVSARLAPEA